MTRRITKAFYYEDGTNYITRIEGEIGSSPFSMVAHCANIHTAELFLNHAKKFFVKTSKPKANIKTIMFDPEDKSVLSVFVEWLEYKHERKEDYKSKKSLELAYKKLLNLSNRNIDIARKIIEEAMSNNYAGFFALKDNGRQQIVTKTNEQSNFKNLAATILSGNGSKDN